MKTLVALLLFAISASAQRFSIDFPRESMKEFFNNVNGELCIHLYEKADAYSKYRVFLVLENLEQADIEILMMWNKLTQSQKNEVVQRWAREGKRTEVERAPYLSYSPVFPTEKTVPVLKAPEKALNQVNLWYPEKSPLE